MTREEAIKAFEEIKENAQNNLGAKWAHGCDGYYRDKIELADVALSALRTPTREQVEKVRGEWIVEDAGEGDRRRKCSMCSNCAASGTPGNRFCHHCGSPMTDEALEMVMERLEALKDEDD